MNVRRSVSYPTSGGLWFPKGTARFPPSIMRAAVITDIFFEPILGSKTPIKSINLLPQYCAYQFTSNVIYYYYYYY